MALRPYYFMFLYRLTSSCILMELKLYLPDIRRNRWRSENCSRHAPKKGRNGKTCRCLHCPSWYMYSHSKQLLVHKIYMHACTRTHAHAHAHARTCVESSFRAIFSLGGYGTMEELLEIISWSQLGIHEKPVRSNGLCRFYIPPVNIFTI